MAQTPPDNPSIRSAIPQPCMSPRLTALSTSISNVPGNRSPERSIGVPLKTLTVCGLLEWTPVGPKGLGGLVVRCDSRNHPARLLVRRWRGGVHETTGRLFTELLLGR